MLPIRPMTYYLSDLVLPITPIQLFFTLLIALTLARPSTLALFKTILYLYSSFSVLIFNGCPPAFSFFPSIPSYLSSHLFTELLLPRPANPLSPPLPHLPPLVRSRRPFPPRPLSHLSPLLLPLPSPCVFLPSPLPCPSPGQSIHSLSRCPKCLIT